MKFTEAEVRFLIGEHRLETATCGRGLRAAVDMRELGCPAAIFEKILEDRARRLGTKFTEFRAAQTKLSAEQERAVRDIASGTLRAAGLSLDDRLNTPNLF